MTGEFSWELNPQRCVSNSHIYLYLWRLSFLTKITILCFVVVFFFFQCSWKSENSWAWAGWWSYELCVFQNLNLLFCFRLRALSPPPASCRHFSDFSLAQRRSHQWFLLFGVNIPNVSLFYMLYFCRHWEVLLRLCEACNNGKSQHRSQCTARKRDVKPNTFILLCLSRSSS